MPGLQPYQYAALRIWENMEEWALNVFNLPLAGHDGDTDTQIASLPGPPPGTPTRGQLESSLRTRAQLEKEGFPAEGEPDFLRLKGTPGIFLISQKTGHGTSPLVRQRLDAFLKEWGDKGQTSPEHIRFVTYTTRYNRDYWVSVDGLEKHYERADVDAQRAPAASTTRSRRTTSRAWRCARRNTPKQIDHRRADAEGEVRSRDHAAEDGAARGRSRRTAPGPGLHKTHALQGPIDDAFLDPFLLVRPTGTPWNEAVNQQALRVDGALRPPVGQILPRPSVREGRQGRDRGRYREVSRRAVRRPGQQRVMAKMMAKLPVQWTKETVTLGGQSYPAERELSGDDLSEPAESGEIRGAEYRPDDRGSRVQRRLRHAAVGRLRHRQGEGRRGRARPGGGRNV